MAWRTWSWQPAQGAAEDDVQAPLLASAPTASLSGASGELPVSSVPPGDAGDYRGPERQQAAAAAGGSPSLARSWERPPHSAFAKAAKRKLSLDAAAEPGKQEGRRHTMPDLHLLEAAWSRQSSAQHAMAPATPPQERPRRQPTSDSLGSLGHPHGDSDRSSWRSTPPERPPWHCPHTEMCRHTSGRLESWHSPRGPGPRTPPWQHTGPLLAHPSASLADARAYHCAEAVRAWQGSLRWVVLWGVLSGLGGVQTGATLWVLGALPLAVITACLFGWADLLGLGAAAHALIAECTIRGRGDSMAAAKSLGLKAVEVTAFISGTVSALAGVVHFFTLQLMRNDSTHLPACPPDQRYCIETYNLLLVLLVGTVLIHALQAVSALVVLTKAHFARQLLQQAEAYY